MDRLELLCMVSIVRHEELIDGPEVALFLNSYDWLILCIYASFQ
jgi:hypothetical protein